MTFCLCFIVCLVLRGEGIKRLLRVRGKGEEGRGGFYTGNVAINNWT